MRKEIGTSDDSIVFALCRAIGITAAFTGNQGRIGKALRRLRSIYGTAIPGYQLLEILIIEFASMALGEATLNPNSRQELDIYRL